MIWKERIKELLLSGLKYCFTPHQDGSFPVINELELYGDGKEAGFMDAVYAAVNHERRLAFFQGYRAGASDACVDMGKEYDFVEDVSNVGAWKAWGRLDDPKS